MSDDERSGDEDQPSEAELALQKRRAAARQVSASGLDDEAKELLETNRQDRERMEDEIRELKKRNEKRKKEREVEEKRLAAERAADEERRKAADEAKRRQKEEEELKRRKERDSKKAESEVLKSNKPNFVITKRSDSSPDEDSQSGKKSREQLDREKKAILKQRIVALNADGLDQSGLKDKAKELHKLMYRLESEKYDLEKRYKQQQVEMLELAERARQANRGGRDGVKRVVLAEGESDRIQERFAGAPAKIEMYSKYERQKDKRTYPERQTVYTGPTFLFPAVRIQPTRIIKWSEGGLPVYEEIAGAGGEGGEGEGEGH